MNNTEIEAMIDRKEDPGKIVKAIETIPEPERSLPVVLYLARYLFQKAHADKDYDLWLKTSKMLDVREEDDPDLYYLQAFGYLYTGWPDECVQVCGYTLEHYRGRFAQFQPLIQLCVGIMSLPWVHETFHQRVQHFWQVFRQNEDSICRTISRVSYEHMDKSQRDLLNKSVVNFFHLALDEVRISFGDAGNRSYILIFLPKDNHEAPFIYDYILQRKPPLKNLWEWYDCMGAQPPVPLGTMSSWKIWLEPQEDGRVEILADTSNGGRKNTRADVMEDQLEKLRRCLNEPTLLGSISAIRIIRDHFPDRPPDTDVPNLESALKKRNLYWKSCHDLVQNRVLRWRVLTPKKTLNPDDAGLRTDAVTIETRFPELHDDYLRTACQAAEKLFHVGAIAGFLYYPIQATDTYRRVLEDALRSIGSDYVFYLGHTEGWCFQYIDFIAWDFDVFLKRIMKILKDAPVEWVHYHTFYPSAQPVMLYPTPDPILDISQNPFDLEVDPITTMETDPGRINFNIDKMFRHIISLKPSPATVTSLLKSLSAMKSVESQPADRKVSRDAGPKQTIRSRPRPSGGTISRKKKGKKKR